MTSPDPHPPPADGSAPPHFLLGGGEMGSLMRRHDWSASSLGPPSEWPQSLRTMVRLMLNTGHPMYIWWGPELACLYNDAYRESIGPERHPGSLGRPAREVWGEIWPVIGPQIEHVMAGRGATWHVNQLVPITRHGRLDDVYWTYSYSPIDDEGAPAGIGGVLVVCTETTQQVLAARQMKLERDRLAQLFEQAPIFMALLEGPEHRITIANPAYLQLVGERPVIGRTVAEALPEAAAQGYLRLLDGVYAEGKAYGTSAARYERPVQPGGSAEERFVDFVYQPIRDAGNDVVGVFVLGADVTERVRAQQSTREVDTTLRAALKAGRMGYWETDYVTKVRTWSEEGMKLFGLDLADRRGRYGGPDDEYLAALHPEDRRVAEALYDTAERHDSFAAEYRIVHSNGSTLWLSGRGAVTLRAPDGKPLRLVSIMADVTEAKKAEVVLRLERERLQLAFTAGQMGAYEFDLVARTLWWSPETYRLFGVEPSSFVPSPESVLARVHPDDRAGFIERRTTAIERRAPLFDEVRIRRPDQSEAWLAYRGHAEYDADGRPTRTFGIVMDITERKRAEELLRNADRQKDDFLATLSHELRNPLAPIRNAVAVLRRIGAADPRAAQCLGLLERQTAQMARLLDDLLDVSRLTRGQLKLRPQPIELAAAIEHAIETAQPSIDKAGHRLSVAIASEPMPLVGDLTRLAQVLSNVLINAAKYTPPGGWIMLTATREGPLALVSIADTGIGIAPAELENIFRMFWQVRSDQEMGQGGQGIGLALARSLIELHGGSIEARSEGVGRGSTFEVRLPLSPRLAPSPAQAAAAAPPAGESRG